MFFRAARPIFAAKIKRIHFSVSNSCMKSYWNILLLIIIGCVLCDSVRAGVASAEPDGGPVASVQTNRSFSPLIHTLQTIVNDDWMQPAVFVLGSDDYVTVSFDYFSHEYHRLCCHLEHCDADGRPSELNESEYMEGFNDRPIDYYLNSLNTTFLYTHYAVDFPNDNVELKVSGNYRVFIYEDDESQQVNELTGQQALLYKGHPIVAEAWFSVVEPMVTVSAEVSSNTDIDTHVAFQQVSFNIIHPDYAIERPDREVKVLVCQNHRPDVAVAGIQPTYIRPGRLEYVHNRNLIFPGNNEFRRFEVINMHYSSQHVDKIDFYDPYYHAVLMADSERRAYSFDADHNGRFLVRYNLAEDNDTEADYLFAHFSLEVPHPFECGKMYVTGYFSDYNYSPDFLMNYNPATSAYECTVLLKMGAYDYQYVFKEDGATGQQVNRTARPFDGSFYETENEYTIYVWHRPFGSRYDRLVAVETVGFSQE